MSTETTTKINHVTYIVKEIQKHKEIKRIRIESEIENYYKLKLKFNFFLLGFFKYFKYKKIEKKLKSDLKINIKIMIL
jgi:hypothetical protein